MTQPIAYGIDFGTTNSAVAVAFPDRTEVLKVAAGAYPKLLQSVLYLSRNRQELAGQEAVTQYSNTAMAQTRCSDCSLAHFSRAGVVSDCKWAAPGGGCADSRIVFGVKQFLAQGYIDSTHSWGRNFTLSYLSAVVIRRLKVLADAQLNRSVDRVVIGHPVRFSGERAAADHDRALERLVGAAKEAGFEDVELMDEPVAAYMATSHQGGPLVSLDFGGGTFDVAVIDGASNQVMAKRGVAVGGEEFDALIFDAKLAGRFGLDEPPVPNHIRESLRSLSASCFLLGNPRALNELVGLPSKAKGLTELVALINGGHLVALHRSVEKAKIELSSITQTAIVLERRGIDIQVPLTRAEFESVIGASLRSIQDEIRLALEDACVGADQVKEVTCTGGSSQIPAFRALVSQTFERSRITEVPVFDTVVTGLAERAHIRWGKPAPAARSKVVSTAASVGLKAEKRPTYVDSDDGAWRWDGAQWLSRYSKDGKQYWTNLGWQPAHSPDLNWWWNGTKWVAARSGQWWWNGRAWVDGR